ncbi:OBERON-like protein [Gastrolobium bilobum]|uniref:OBERON-like protein n=1 Tax=Gastrolobium bilobum TaxID=150636 RepID=UPI002AB17694|nr:OBERON-like protein [Gastrolobium bilobum]
MEADGNNNGGAHNNLWNLTPVAAHQSGKGLPYAPENWPNSGDVWGWRTGKRVAAIGHFLDRYLYPPTRLCDAAKLSPKQRGIASKLSLERYIKEFFPHVHLNDFFSLFSWKIPSLHHGNAKTIASVPLPQFALAKQSESDFPSYIVGCKARNPMCSGLILEEQEEEKYSPAMPCDICCTEPGFCRDCCCILCSKIVNSAYGGYNYIKCQVKIGDNICGHVTHIECALRCRMAGTVGGSIGLDAEYYCRRCDGRTDLISHVDKLLQTCEAIDMESDLEEKILNLCFSLLCGSQKAIAKELLSHIELAISKVKCETNAEDISNVDDNLIAHFAGFSDNDSDAMDVTDNESPSDVGIGAESSGFMSDSLKLEAEIDEVLQALRKSQEFEYNMAAERLNAHKNYLQNLYQQLDREKSEEARLHRSSRSRSALVHAVAERKEQIRLEVIKFEDMKKVANGFGSTSKDILKERFGL